MTIEPKAKCYADVEARLMDKVEYDTNGGCWLFRGVTLPAGYGHLKMGNRSVLAHRVSWSIRNGEIPPGMLVRHKCDVPSCVNPDHLVTGTHADNTADMIKRGRMVSRRTGPRLTSAQVAIMENRLKDGWRDARIAEELGVARNTIGRRRRAIKTPTKPTQQV